MRKILWLKRENGGKPKINNIVIFVVDIAFLTFLETSNKCNDSLFINAILRKINNEKYH